MSNEALSKLQIINYDVDYSIKTMMVDDTSRWVGSSTMERNEADTLTGFKAHIIFNGYEKIYTGDKAYEIGHKEKLAFVYDPIAEGAASIEGHVTRNMLVDRLMKGFDMASMTADKYTLTRSQEDESEQYWVVLRETKVDDTNVPDYHNLYKIWINKVTLVPERILSISNTKGRIQYQNTVLSSIKFNESSLDNYFENLEVPAGYEIQYPQPHTPTELKTLTVGTIAPDFTLTNTNGEEVKLSDLKGKVVLLDFWYLSCYPCLQAMPHLQALHTSFSSNGLVVLGINSKDNPKRKEKVKTYLQEESITYQTLFASDAIDNAYNVKAFPTVYVIGKDGKVLAARIGFNEDVMKELESIVSKAL